ncbi:hypothetical protein RSAG8_04320, partial [Rhizoctonia solani AG-8 WAC10335]
MIQLFHGLLPHLRLPVHQTLQRHLYRLFDALQLLELISARKSLTEALQRLLFVIFGEGAGMIQPFHGLLPHLRLPVHQTLQRHLYRLFDALVPKVKDILKRIERHAISIDAWSSKNSVYSLAGIILFYIDNSWSLNELVIDVVDLDAEHSGSLMGKLVYSALQAKGAARQAIACVTDNASANSVMNETLSASQRSCPSSNCVCYR